jgi:dihydroorotase
MELYAEVFESIDSLPLLEAFASINGPVFFGFPFCEGTITLVREPWKVVGLFYVEDDEGLEPMRPFRMGETMLWKLSS